MRNCEIAILRNWVSEIWGLILNPRNSAIPTFSQFFSGQTPDFPATHAAVATVAPFPAWRGSQG